MRERDWDTEWCTIHCELCGVDCRDGAASHFVTYGHVPVVGGEPIMVGVRRRPVWKFEWKRKPYDWEAEGTA